MIEEDREKRIEAALLEFCGSPEFISPEDRKDIEAVLDAADRAVPVVSRAFVDEHYAERWKLVKRTADLKRAEAAARDFAKALRFYERALAGEVAASALAAHPGFAEPRA